MQFDPTGALASIMSMMLPENGITGAAERGGTVGEFDQFLHQLSAVLEEHSTGQLPLDSNEWGQWMHQLESSVEGGGDFVENLQALKSHLEALLQQLDPDNSSVQGEARIDLSSNDETAQMHTEDILDSSIGPSILQEIKQPLLTSFEASDSGAVGDDLSSEEKNSDQSDQIVAPVILPAGEKTPQPDVADDSSRGLSFRTGDENARRMDSALNIQPEKEGESSMLQPLDSKPESVHSPVRELPNEMDSQHPQLTEADFPEAISAQKGMPLEPTSLQPSDKTPQGATLNLSRPLDHPDWADELGQRLLWMHGKTVQTAELRINPQHLGPVEVRIQVHDDQTSIQFTSHHAAVREVIESALPRLKEMFAVQQLQLSQVDVSGQSLHDQRSSQDDQESAGERSGFYAGEESALVTETVSEAAPNSSVAGTRLLNLYV